MGEHHYSSECEGAHGWVECTCNWGSNAVVRSTLRASRWYQRVNGPLAVDARAFGAEATDVRVGSLNNAARPSAASFLGRLETSAAFIYDVQRSIEGLTPRLKRGQPELASRVPPALAQDCALLALVADVDAVIADLNIVLADIDKLGADSFAFGDTNPFARFKFLLRAAQAEFEHCSELFDQFLLLCASSHKLTQPERRRLQAIFKERVRLLLTAGKSEELTTSRTYPHADDYGALLRGLAYIQSRIEAAEPVHTTAVEWTKRMQPRVQLSRRRIFDVGMRLAKVWSGGIALFTSQKEVDSTRRRRRASTRRLVRAGR